MGGSNLFTGTLDLLILHTLSGGAKHGYLIGRWISQQTDGILDVEEGVLYPALHRLSKKAWIRGTWGETDTGRRARFYSLTRKGRKALEREMARWEEHVGAVGAVLRSSEG
jgi:transcriptional regulator